MKHIKRSKVGAMADSMRELEKSINEWMDNAFEKMFDLMQITPGRGYPEDVANLVLFLVSEESRFITGEIINVDGGVAAKL